MLGGTAVAGDRGDGVQAVVPTLTVTAASMARAQRGGRNHEGTRGVGSISQGASLHAPALRGMSPRRASDFTVPAPSA